jgi:hypothetical protein
MTLDKYDIIIILICLILSIGITIIVNRHRFNCKSKKKHNSIIYKEIYDI